MTYNLKHIWYWSSGNTRWYTKPAVMRQWLLRQWKEELAVGDKMDKRDKQWLGSEKQSTRSCRTIRDNRWVASSGWVKSNVWNANGWAMTNEQWLGNRKWNVRQAMREEIQVVGQWERNTKEMRGKVVQAAKQSKERKEPQHNSRGQEVRWREVRREQWDLHRKWMMSGSRRQGL